jgi:hypothetical protein
VRPLLGDEGSGYAIGSDLLKAVVRAVVNNRDISFYNIHSKHTHTHTHTHTHVQTIHLFVFWFLFLSEFEMFCYIDLMVSVFFISCAL